MDAFDINEALLLADFSSKQKFQGLSNTRELFDTINEMFSGTSTTIKVDFVQGRPEEFKGKFMADIRSEDDVDKLLNTFERNTYIVTKKSKSW